MRYYPGFIELTAAPSIMHERRSETQGEIPTAKGKAAERKRNR